MINSPPFLHTIQQEHISEEIIKTPTLIAIIATTPKVSCAFRRWELTL
jgi:hypothetical protein